MSHDKMKQIPTRVSAASFMKKDVKANPWKNTTNTSAPDNKDFNSTFENPSTSFSMPAADTTSQLVGIAEERLFERENTQDPSKNFNITIYNDIDRPEIEGDEESSNPILFDLPSWVLPHFENGSVAKKPKIVAAESNESNNDCKETSPAPDHSEESQSRVSAFERLGPILKPKRPKLTINLLFSKENEVREVVDEVIEDQDPMKILNESSDELAIKFLDQWPWNKPMVIMPEKGDLEEKLFKYTTWIKIRAHNYPPNFKKEDVLNLIMDNVKDPNFIPCFIKHTSKECLFLVQRCPRGLASLLKLNGVVQNSLARVMLKINATGTPVARLDFIPRLVLRRRLALSYDEVANKLDLSSFCIQPDVSLFIFFPLSREENQSEIITLQSTIIWENLVELNLSKNNLRSISEFELLSRTPKLKVLDLSDNCLEKMTDLLKCKGLMLTSLSLEGNPLCADFTDPTDYTSTAKLLFPSLRLLDGVLIKSDGNLPNTKPHYCPFLVQDVIDKFLRIYFPLLELPSAERLDIRDMYHKKAILSVTFRERLRHSLQGSSRALLGRNRDGGTETGAANVAKLISTWPCIQHDHSSFTVDVLHYEDTTIIFRVDGCIKVIAKSLVDDEQVLYFSRSVVLRSENGCRFVVQNELLFWDLPSAEYASCAFKRNLLKTSHLITQLDVTPNEYGQENLITIFKQLTGLKTKASERCLKIQKWNLKSSLEYFVLLYEENNLAILEQGD